MTTLRFPVAVIVQRTPLANRWASEHWEPVAVEPSTTDGPANAPTRLPGAASDAPWRFDGHAFELHRSEAEGYFLNVTAPEPKVFVAMRPADAPADAPDEPPLAPALVTVSYNEAARMLDGGGRIDAVPMPSQVRAVLEAFVAMHYRPEPRRKIRRNDPFGDGERSRDEGSRR